MLLGHGHWDPLPPTFFVPIENFEKFWILFWTFVGTALFPQGLWEQKIGSLLVVPTNLWDQLFPQRLWEQQMVVSYWLFPQICRNSILFIMLHKIHWLEPRQTLINSFDKYWHLILSWTVLKLRQGASITCFVYQSVCRFVGQSVPKI